jgi:anti-anti-sigma factor
MIFCEDRMHVYTVPPAPGCAVRRVTQRAADVAGGRGFMTSSPTRQRRSNAVMCQVLYAAGELDIDTAAGLRRTLADAGRDPDRDVVVDLSGVTFVDCAGLRPLLEARTRLRERLWLRSPPRPVTLLLGHTGLLDTFQILGSASTRTAAPGPRGSHADVDAYRSASTR